MSQTAPSPLQPRKTPQQVRSNATVAAILEAAIQVLIAEGSRLTTTRVAARAGVSVGTLYQYFPNKASLLRAVLQQHLGGVTDAVEAVCIETRNRPLHDMVESLVAAFVDAKFRNVKASAALYRISDDVQGRQIALTMHTRVTASIAGMLITASDARFALPERIAETLLHTMAGLSRGVLESEGGSAAKADMQTEMTRLAHAYVQASAQMGTAGNVTDRVRAGTR